MRECARLQADHAPRAVEQTCTCPDYELRRMPCKHYEACLFWPAWDGSVDEETGQVTAPKKQSKQDWRAYNAAQTTERERVPQFLIEGEHETADLSPGRLALQWKHSHEVLDHVAPLVGVR